MGVLLVCIICHWTARRIARGRSKLCWRAHERKHFIVVVVFIFSWARISACYKDAMSGVRGIDDALQPLLDDDMLAGLEDLDIMKGPAAAEAPKASSASPSGSSAPRASAASLLLHCSAVDTTNLEKPRKPQVFGQKAAASARELAEKAAAYRAEVEAKKLSAPSAATTPAKRDRLAEKPKTPPRKRPTLAPTAKAKLEVSSEMAEQAASEARHDLAFQRTGFSEAPATTAKSSKVVPPWHRRRAPDSSAASSSAGPSSSASAPSTTEQLATSAAALAQAEAVAKAQAVVRQYACYLPEAAAPRPRAAPSPRAPPPPPPLSAEGLIRRTQEQQERYMRAASTGGLRAAEAYRERPGHEHSRFGTRSKPNRRCAWWFKGRRDAVAAGTLREFMQAAPDPYPRALPDDGPDWKQEYTLQQRAKIDKILKRSHVTFRDCAYRIVLGRAPKNLQGMSWVRRGGDHAGNVQGRGDSALEFDEVSRLLPRRSITCSRVDERLPRRASSERLPRRYADFFHGAPLPAAE